jgi:hypothetical protein
MNVDEEWRAYLLGTHPQIAKGRRMFGWIPSASRCGPITRDTRTYAARAQRAHPRASYDRRRTGCGDVRGDLSSADLAPGWPATGQVEARFYRLGSSDDEDTNRRKHRGDSRQNQQRA